MFGDFIPLPLFPKDSESLKFLDNRLWEVGAKRRLNRTSKLNRQTDRRTDTQTDRQTDILTYRKHWPRRPILWKKRHPDLFCWTVLFLLKSGVCQYSLIQFNNDEGVCRTAPATPGLSKIQGELYICCFFEIIGADLFIGKLAFPAWLQGNTIWLVSWVTK